MVKKFASGQHKYFRKGGRFVMMYKIANENLAITKQDRKAAIEHNLQFVIKDGLYLIDVEVESRKKLELDSFEKQL